MMRIKISKKEAKESRYWLILSDPGRFNEELKRAKGSLINESIELMKIFGSILEKSK